MPLRDDVKKNRSKGGKLRSAVKNKPKNKPGAPSQEPAPAVAQPIPIVPQPFEYVRAIARIPGLRKGMQ